MRLNFLLVWFVLVATVVAQNSKRKIRARPSTLAAQAGTAVPWRASLEAAVREAQETDKLVFWYVPTAAGSPMDRKPEIDRYMMAGAFSWPSTIDLLSQKFIPVKQKAGRDEVATYGLRRGVFIEPGWLVLDGDGKEVARMQQLTTLHPMWFEAPLRRLVGSESDEFPCHAALREAWRAYRGADRQRCLEEINLVLAQDPSAAVSAEALWLRGACLRRLGLVDEAQAVWRDLADRFADSTWASKAAMEVEGHGPFSRGFEVYLELPERVLRDTTEGSRAPSGTYTEQELWQKSVEFLLSMADADGVMRDSTYDFGGTDGLPNVYLAVSFLAGEALLCAAERQDRGLLSFSDATRKAIERQLELLLVAARSGPFAVEDRDEILWAYAYRTRFLARWAQLRSGDADKIDPLLRSSVTAVAMMQPDNGAWFHEYSNPFAIATALQALAAARDHGAEMEQATIDRGLRALVQCRVANGAYSYGYSAKRPPRATLEAAAGRMPLCELALLLWEQSNQEKLEAALQAAFEHHGLLAAVRKYDDHADRHGYGGFFFWFDMLGRAEAVMQVADKEQRDAWRDQQRQLVLDLPEFDGVFVDSHELGRCYGSAMALLCLATLQP
ncbi:MAG: hypothetical protein VYE77_08425 [Planctomycetota bacterium]|nr:hypothetical protein [Planctomycetota bacterium]